MIYALHLYDSRGWRDNVDRDKANHYSLKKFKVIYSNGLAVLYNESGALQIAPRGPAGRCTNAPMNDYCFLIYEIENDNGFVKLQTEHDRRRLVM